MHQFDTWHMILVYYMIYFSLCLSTVPPCIQQMNHSSRVRHEGVQLGECEEVRSVRFLYVAKGT